jgi:hypothetical protein
MFFKRQVFTNVSPGENSVPSGTVTSVKKVARSLQEVVVVPVVLVGFGGCPEDGGGWVATGGSVGWTPEVQSWGQLLGFSGPSQTPSPQRFAVPG